MTSPTCGDVRAQLLLILMPFVLVAMIAAVRRILVLTAELGTLMEQGEAVLAERA